MHRCCVLMEYFGGSKFGCAIAEIGVVAAVNNVGAVDFDFDVRHDGQEAA